jgi:hypothetical protein
MGPEPPVELLAVEKPVLYFQPNGTSPLAIASVRVDARGGTIVEHWPDTGVAGAPASIAWTGLRLERGGCALTAPAVADPVCVRALAASGECESAALARAVASDAGCLHGGAFSTPLLFYRSTSTALTAPLRASHRGSNDIEIQNGGNQPIPGRLVRFQREGATVRAVVADPPGPGATVVIGDTWVAPEVARRAVGDTLTGLGLTRTEANAFLASWDVAFFGAPAEQSERSLAAEEMPPPEDSILYFLPPGDIERLSHLSFDPAPTEVRRAMAVWSALR